jgi:hypothetical protein
LQFGYQAYGLTLASDFELPELKATPGIDESPDVSIILDKAPVGGLPGGTQISPFIWVGENDFLLEVPNIGRFRVMGENQIIVDPAPGTDEASIRVFLLGSALGALLFQRNLLVLHGNAVEIGNRCLVCVGSSGIGKSTLTAAFMQRGYRVLADDVVPVDEAGFAIPGFPRIKLWQDVAEKLQIGTSNLTRIRPLLEKYSLPLGSKFCDESRPISQICVLSEHEGDGIVLTPVTGMEKFSLLKANTYRQRFMSGMSLQPTHLRQCGALASKVRIARVQRPRAGFQLDALVDRLLDQMQERA